MESRKLTSGVDVLDEHFHGAQASDEQTDSVSRDTGLFDALEKTN